MRHLVNIINSTVASSIRGWRGTSGSKSVQQPEQPLFLFDREGDAECRLVREVITGLNLDVTIMPCPLGGRNIQQLKRESGSDMVPVLFDANVEERRVGADDIIQYLYREYKNVHAPERLKATTRNLRLSQLSSLIRLNKGIKARPAKPAERPLRLFSFESSPFSRVVRELLCELELPYELITLGKQQRADMGPAVFRMHLGEYKPVEDSKREHFLKEYGDVQVPYLDDPNTGVGMFESKDIVEYLLSTYAK